MKNNNCKISVIIPVFNNLQYIKKSIDSVINQSYKNLEIIILNGAIAKEESSILLEEYKDIKNVKIVNHSSKLTLFEARILGFENTTGDYIAYVDSDDTISIDYYRLLAQKAMETDADIVLADTLEVQGGKTYYFNYDPILNTDIILDENCFEFFINNGVYYCRYWNVWNKIYKRELFEKSILRMKKYGPISMGEDILFSSNLWANAKKIRNVHNAYYNYYIHNDSSTGQSISLEGYQRSIDSLNKVMTNLDDLCQKILGDKSNISKWRRYVKSIWQNKANELLDLDNFRAIEMLNEAFPEKLNEIDWEQFGYFYSQKIVVNNFYYKYEYIKELICSNKISVVSFDIFDTLLKRDVFEPKDIFVLLNEEYNKLGNNTSLVYFSSIREAAERNCRNKLIDGAKEEITIDEIYKEIETSYKIDKKITAKLKAKELDLELEHNKPRKIIRELYDLAKYCNKKVMCISDIYLSLDTIKNLLHKNGYIMDEYFVSADLSLTKETGNIYEYVKNNMNIEFSEILHIGDNYHTDYENAKNIGINAFHIPKILELFSNSSAYRKAFFENKQSHIDYFDSLKFLGNRCVLATVANKIYDTSSIFSVIENLDYNGNYKTFGYFALGTALLANVCHINKVAINKKANKLHFVSRDGYLLKKGYDILKEKLQLKSESNYLYSSRKMLMPLSISSKEDILSLFFSNQNFNLTPIKFYEICDQIIGLSKEEFIKECQERNIAINQVISNETNVTFMHLLNDIFDQNKVDKYRADAKNYYQNVIEENDMIVDIGYSGRAEAIFSTLLGYPVNSWYLHTNGSTAYDRAKFNDFNINTYYYSRPKLTGIIREYLYMKLDNSCQKIIFTASEPKFMFEDKFFSAIEVFINNIIQQSALELINDFCDIFPNFPTYDFKYQDLNIFLENFLYSPEYKDAYIFKIVGFEDDFEKDAKNFNLFNVWINQLKSMKELNFTMSTPNVDNEEVTYPKRNILKRGIIKIFRPLYSKIKCRTEGIIAETLDNKLSNTNDKLNVLINQNRELKEKIDLLESLEKNKYKH